MEKKRKKIIENYIFFAQGIFLGRSHMGINQSIFFSFFFECHLC